MTRDLIDLLADAAESLHSVQPHAPTLSDAIARAADRITAQDAVIDRLERELREARADRDIAEARARGLEADVALLRGALEEARGRK